jgi:aspartate/methionine/tyrosine aminotransferase
MNGEGALAVFARACELERAGRNIIHLELGEPDFHPAFEVQQALQQALSEGRDRYTAAGGVPALQEAIAGYLGRTRNLPVDPQNVVVAPGCKPALALAMQAIVEDGDEVLCPDPSFPIYPSLTRALGGKPVMFGLREENGFQPDPDEIVRKVSGRTKLLVVNSPNNPTGTVLSADVRRAIVDLALQHDLLVISDEVYARVIYGQSYTSVAGYPGMIERTAIVDGLSKSFAMTGWRLGYVVVPTWMVSALHMLVVNSFTSVAEFIQHAAIVALHDPSRACAHMVKVFAERRERFLQRLNQVPGFRTSLPDGAFYAWVNIAGTGLSAEELCRLMLEEAGVAGIPGAAFGTLGREFVRFSFAASTEKLDEAVTRILALSSRWAPVGATPGLGHSR